ncbi:MAG: sodium:alanine symporter family protein [Legionellales bacterium]|nr:sodium:alanine symporter family protein [Legionellales bacterium]
MFIEKISLALSMYIIVPMAVISGIYLSIRFKFIQITQSKAILFSIKTNRTTGTLSSFNAISAVLGGNLGVGNISGMAIALATGGPGALFWMWIIVVLFSIIKFGGCYLGVIFRKKNSQGELVGGPMYYIRQGLKQPTLANLFCYLIIIIALISGNIVQMHSLLLPLKNFSISPFYLGILVACLIAGVTWGGMRRFANFVSLVVPFMGLLYLGISLFILFIYFDRIPYAFEIILKSAFGFHQFSYGGLGFTVFMAISTAFDRVLLSTDIGMGLAPIIHASVNDSCELKTNALKQGYASLLSPVIVILICTITMLVLIVTGVWKGNYESTNMCIAAFRIGLGTTSAGNIIIVVLFFFAFTTILTWMYCASRAIEYLYGINCYHKIIFQILFISIIPLGIYCKKQVIWYFSDILMNIMFILNTGSILALSNLIDISGAKLFKSLRSDVSIKI